MSKQVNAMAACAIARHMLIGNGRESAKRKCEIKLWRAGVLMTKGKPQ